MYFAQFWGPKYAISISDFMLMLYANFKMGPVYSEKDKQLTLLFTFFFYQGEQFCEGI